MIIQPTRILSKHVDYLHEIHLKMDPNLSLPKGYYDKLKIEVRQRRIEEMQKAAEEAKRMSQVVIHEQSNTNTSTITTVEENKVEEEDRKQTPSNDNRLSRWDSERRDGRKHERDYNRYNDRRRSNGHRKVSTFILI